MRHAEGANETWVAWRFIFATFSWDFMLIEMRHRWHRCLTKFSQFFHLANICQESQFSTHMMA